MTVLTRNKRNFLSEELCIKNWEDIEKYYTALTDRAIENTEDLAQWIADRSETDAAIEEESRWRYIRQTCNTENESYKSEYENFIETILPKLMIVTNQLNKKIAENPFIETLDKQRFFIYLRGLQNQLNLFREQNIPLAQQTQLSAQEYGAIIAAMMVENDNQQITLPQAQVFLQDENRTKRKNIFEKINERRLQDRQKLNTLFTDLLNVRNQIAQNAGFSNYRDYMFAELGRFDYGVKECEDFHEAIKSEVIPLVKKIHQKRKKELQEAVLYPYDLDVETNGKALTPFTDEADLIQKTITCLNAVDSFFGESISIMQNMNHLDLNSRKGKAPGGYNMPLPEIGVPFIFMNAAGTHRDLETMVHEAGHAVHSFLTRTLPYNFDEEITSETAELASMSMELMTFDGLDAFYNDVDKKRAIKTHLEGIITMLPWIAIVDKFQHWIYTNPTHTEEEREQKFVEIQKEFSSGEINWNGYEKFQEIGWQKQLHIFEVPFYYIEYGIAQLGAIAVWRNYKQNKVKAIADYKNALSLGYTKTIPDIYKTAGIEFNFSKDYVKELMCFLQEELNKI